MSKSITLYVNGESHDLDVESTTPLLYVLRNHLELYASKFGCGLGQCGACMVIVDDHAVYSCQVSISDVAGRKIETLENLNGKISKEVQAAFIEEQAAQCGYCTNGMIMSSVALLRRMKSPGEADIRTALHGNLCRCGVHARVIKAVKRAIDNINVI